MASSLTMTRADRVTLSAKATLSLSNAPLVSNPTWTSDQPTKINLVPSADGFSCVAKATGLTGVVIVTCTAVGQTTMTDTVTITITTNIADTLDVTAGTASPQY